MLLKNTFEEYLEMEGLSRSTLVNFLEMEDQDHAESAAMAMGSLIHTLTLEPDEFNSRYYVTDAERRGTKAWAEDESRASPLGLEVIKAKDYEEALLIAQSVREHSEAMEYLKNAQIEVSMQWKDTLTGLVMKARFDALTYGRYAADLKSCVSVKNDAFSKNVFTHRYDIQDAFYTLGIAELNGIHWGEVEPMVFIAVEKEAKRLAGTTAKRHQVGLFTIQEKDRFFARAEVREALDVYANCLKSGNWPAYQTTLQQVVKPSWIENKQNEEAY